MTSDYLIEDVLCEGLHVVFCGTALGHESAKQKAYYAKSGNRFWRALHETGLTDRRLAPKEYALMPSLKMGLTDMCKTVFGNDDELPGHAPDAKALKQKILKHQPQILAFTSKKAASFYLGRDTGDIPYGLQQERIGATRIFVLPSPSGQATKYWDQGIWEELAALVKALR